MTFAFESGRLVLRKKSKADHLRPMQAAAIPVSSFWQSGMPRNLSMTSAAWNLVTQHWMKRGNTAN